VDAAAMTAAVAAAAAADATNLNSKLQPQTKRPSLQLADWPFQLCGNLCRRPGKA
jgi:hypothetical protein